MSLHPASAEVLIAGGGPAGLAAAVELGSRGIDVVVLEPRDRVSADRPRAKTTSTRTMEHMRRWGVAGRIREVATLPVAWSQDATFVTALLGREITRIGGCFGLSAGRPVEAAESGQQIGQPSIESVLRQTVTNMPSVRLLTGCALVSLQQHPDVVVVDVRDRDGSNRRIRAEYVLGCDGAHSLVRAAVGARFEGRADERTNFNVVFRAPGLLERVPMAPAIHYWVLDPDVPGLLGPLDLAGTWWGMAMGVDAERGNANPVGFVRRLIGPGADDLEIDIVATDPWTARMLIADHYGQGRVYLVGDAAHLNPPWGGHGFNTAVGDAVNIGWKLAAVLRGWGGADLLASYEAERRPIAQVTIDEAAANMRNLSTDLTGPDLHLDSARGDAARRSVAERVHATKDAEFHSQGLVLGYRYDASPIVSPDPAPVPRLDPRRYRPSTRPGGRLPHVWLPDGRSLFDLLGPEFTLLMLDAHAEPATFIAVAERLGVPLRVVALPGIAVPDADGVTMLLIRPDQHIAARWRQPRVDPLVVEHQLGHAVARDPSLEKAPA